MEPGELFVLTLSIVALVAVLSLWTRREQRELYRLLQKQSEKRGGRVKPGTLLYYPKLTYSREGVEIAASAMLGGRRPDRRAATTYVTFSRAVPPGGGFRITRKTKSIQSLLEEKLGSARIQTGNRAFDDRFAVQGENSTAALRFLTERVQSALLAFDEKVDARFESDGFTVKIDGIAEKEATLDRMLDLAALAHESLR